MKQYLVIAVEDGESTVIFNGTDVEGAKARANKAGKSGAVVIILCQKIEFSGFGNITIKTEVVE